MIWQDRCMRGEHSFSVGASLWKSRARCWTATRTAQPKRREPWSNSRPWRCLNHTGDLSWTTWWWPWWPRFVKKQTAVKWLLDMSPNVTKCHQMSPSDINIKASVTDSQIAAAIEICANPGHSKRRLCQHLYGNSWRPSKNQNHQNPSESNFKSFKSSIARRCTCTCNGSPFPMYSHQWWPSQKCRERCRLLGDGTVPVPG